MKCRTTPTVGDRIRTSATQPVNDGMASNVKTVQNDNKLTSVVIDATQCAASHLQAEMRESVRHVSTTERSRGGQMESAKSWTLKHVTYSGDKAGDSSAMRQLRRLL